MGNCLNCNHGVVKFSDLNKIDEDMALVSEPMYVKCLAGNNEMIKEFYKENGHLSRREIDKIKLNCFEPTTVAVWLDNMIDKADKMLSLLEKE